jgi:hypothetical protein
MHTRRTPRARSLHSSDSKPIISYWFPTNFGSDIGRRQPIFVQRLCNAMASVDHMPWTHGHGTCPQCHLDYGILPGININYFPAFIRALGGLLYMSPSSNTDPIQCVQQANLWSQETLVGWCLGMSYSFSHTHLHYFPWFPMYCLCSISCSYYYW